MHRSRIGMALGLGALPAVCSAAEPENPLAWFLFFFVMVAIPAAIFFAVATAVFIPLLRTGRLRSRAVAFALPLLAAIIALVVLLVFKGFVSGGAVIVMATISGVGLPALAYAALVHRFGHTRR